MLVHANGFCKEMYMPIVARLEEACDVYKAPLDALLVDLSSHGSSTQFSAPVEGRDLAQDVHDALDSYLSARPCAQYDRIVGVGHSIGSTALLYAQHARPDFAHLCLVEPILLPANSEGLYTRSPMTGFPEDTLKRRTTFASREAAVANWTGKGAFKRWLPEMLALFAEHALKDAEDGTVQLKCDPKDEAEIYQMRIALRGSLHEITCPVDLINGADSIHVPVHTGLDAQSKMKYPGRMVVVPGATHFVPMEKPDAFVETIINTFHLPRVVSGLTKL